MAFTHLPWLFLEAKKNGSMLTPMHAVEQHKLFLNQTILQSSLVIIKTNLQGPRNQKAHICVSILFLHAYFLTPFSLSAFYHRLLHNRYCFFLFASTRLLEIALTIFTYHELLPLSLPKFISKLWSIYACIKQRLTMRVI